MSMRRRTVLAAGAAAVVGGCTTPSPAASGPNSFAVRGVRVFDGERLTADDTVLVERGRIASAGRGLPVPQGTTVVDGRGGVLLPGLIDSHVHVSDVFASDAAQFGVTTVLDMFCDARRLASFRLRVGSQGKATRPQHTRIRRASGRRVMGSREAVRGDVCGACCCSMRPRASRHPLCLPTWPEGRNLPATSG